MRRRIRNVVIGVLIVAMIGGVTAWQVLQSMPPAWYDPPDPADEQVVVLADRVEYRMTEEFQKIREPEDTWKLRVRDEQINAWLAARLMEWVKFDEQAEWPANLGVPQVHFQPGTISLAVPVGDEADDRRILVARVAPVIEDEMLRCPVDRVGVGRLTLPGSPIARLAGAIEDIAAMHDDNGSSIAQMVTRAITGEEPIEPIVHLADDRHVRIVDLIIEDGAMIITARTLGPDE